MPLFRDPNETVTFTFEQGDTVQAGDTALPVPADLIGETVTVRASITEAERLRNQAALLSGLGSDADGRDEMRMALDRSALDKMAHWLVGASFTDHRGRRCPANFNERRDWWGRLDPVPAAFIRRRLDAHIAAVWGEDEAAVDPTPADS